VTDQADKAQRVQAARARVRELNKRLRQLRGGRTHSGEDYEVHRDREAKRRREQSKAGRDIAPLPTVVDAARRDAASSSFRTFCETYGKSVFSLAWSPDHLLVISRIENAVLNGGLFAIAMPRGSGKTSLCEWAGLWALLNGHRNFVALIGATESDAEDRLESIKTELETNELLLEDYPGACYPVRALEGINARAAGQLLDGKQTNVEWSAKRVTLPDVPGSASAGAVIRITGITGHIRGMQHKRSDGRIVRPDFVIIDDPQTDESAFSLSQSRQREAVLSGAILGLAGPQQKISGVMPCTVIAPGDMADNILDRSKHPEWQGERLRMVRAWPKRMELWEKYRELRNESLRNDGDGSQATEFYDANFDAMNEGADVAWPDRYLADERSALQHAMNLRFRDERSFHAEYQNEPMPPETASASDLNTDELARRLNGLDRGVVPLWATRVSAFVDVQKSCLWWMVCAWGDDFTGAIVDYGTTPDQGLQYFTLAQVRRTLQRAAPGAGLEGAIRAGLDGVAKHLLEREWKRDGGGTARVERLLVDANWGDSTNTVYNWCRETPHAAIVAPSHGRFVGATSTPFSEYKRRPGERVGTHWRVPAASGRRAVRHVLVDVNWWKSFVARRLATAVGDRGAITLFGRKPDVHAMLAEHLTAERAVLVSAKGRTASEWKLVQVGRDNHLLDCLVGSAAAASMLGAALDGDAGSGAQASRQRVKLSDIRKGGRK
jgi:hypothetical protein